MLVGLGEREALELGGTHGAKERILVHRELLGELTDKAALRITRRGKEAPPIVDAPFPLAILSAQKRAATVAPAAKAAQPLSLPGFSGEPLPNVAARERPPLPTRARAYSEGPYLSR